jgi:hypothetical protein
MTAQFLGWTNINDALAGKLVGFQVGSSTSDLSQTGTIKGPGPIYKTYINGYTLKVNANGLVKESIPSGFHVNETLSMVAVSTTEHLDYGTEYATRHDDSTRMPDVNVVSMEPRDEFAVAALKVIMSKLEHPEAADMQTMISYSQSAYRWANCMMDSAIDARLAAKKNQERQGDIEDIVIDPSGLDNNNDKLLYNISLYLKHAAEKGLPVLNAEEEVTEGGQTVTRKVALETVLNDVKKIAGQTIYQGIPVVGAGTTSQTVQPVLSKLHQDSEIKKVAEVAKIANCTDLATLLSTNGIKVAAMPTTTHVTIDGTPNVNVANSPSVSVSNMPSSIDVDNFPATQAVSGTVDIGNWPSNNNT